MHLWDCLWKKIKGITSENIIIRANIRGNLISNVKRIRENESLVQTGKNFSLIRNYLLILKDLCDLVFVSDILKTK